jgi:hypothetical protein
MSIELRMSIQLDSGLLRGLRVAVSVLEVSSRHVVVRMPCWGHKSGTVKRFFRKSGKMCGRPTEGEVWRLRPNSALSIQAT